MPSTITDRLQGLTTSLAIKPPCTAVALTNITLAGLQTVGSVTVVENDRVLVAAQSDASENGIYNASTSDWQRAKDFDGNRDVVQGTLVLVRNGVADGAIFEVTSPNPIIIGTSDIDFELRDDPAITYAQTAAEIAAGVTPTNYAYPPLNVHRYGAIGDGSTDDLVAFQHAVAVAAINGGTITGEQRLYRLSTTLSISGPVTLDFGNSIQSPSFGARLYSTANAPVVTYSSGTYSGYGLRNLTILGSVGAGGSQNGLVINPTYPAQAQLFTQNVAIFNCGNHGLVIATSYGSTFQNILSQGNAGVGILDGPNSGANKFYNVSVVANTGAGIDVSSTNGSSEWYGVTSEQNAYGIAFENGAVGHTMQGVHTEANASGSLLFKSGSNRNRVDFEQWGGGAEPAPLNSGGAQNRWSGNKASGTVLYDAKVVQRVSTIQRAVVTAGSLTQMPYTDVAPVNTQGVEVLSQAITPQAPGNTLVVRAWGFIEANLGTNLIIALFQDSTANAVAAFAQNIVAINTPQRFSIEYETSAPSPITTAITFKVRVGSDSGSAYTVTFGGSGGARKFGGICIGGISVEEQYPSSG